MSSNRVFQFGTGLRTGVDIVCTGESGGTQLSSVTSGINVFSIYLSNNSGNAPVRIGGTGVNAPVSGTGGMLLYGGDNVLLPIDNLADISVVAEVSGQKVSWVGISK